MKIGIKHIALLVVLFSGSTLSQRMDSIFNDFTRMRLPNEIPDSPSGPLHDDRKCGFGITAQVRFNIDGFSTTQQAILKPLLERPVTSTSIVSPRGFFKIHFDESGYNKPNYSALDLAIALDSSYVVEVERMGFPPPPPDNGAGGDNKYDVYIQTLGGTYGYTMPENEITPGSDQYTSYIVINSDFTGFYTSGINAARVTAAHEFHHSIQMGNYAYKEVSGEIEDLFFYELTSTSMEEFVFDNVNDYYGYMKSFFTYPDKPLQLQSGYNLAIWNIFLKERVGEGVFVKQWEQFKTKRALTSIDIALNSYNTSFYDEFKEFAVWAYFTGYRSVSGKYFKDAAEFPATLKPLVTAQVNYPFTELKFSDSKPTAINYLRFYKKDATTNDTIAALIVNADIQKGIIPKGGIIPSIPFSYTLAPSSLNGFYTVIDGQYYAKLESTEMLSFSNSEIVNDLLANSGSSIKRQVDFVYPSPFNYSKHTYLNFALPPSAEGYCDLHIFDINSNLIYSGTVPVKNNIGMRTIQWNGMNNRGEKAGSGVYLYAIRIQGETLSGKLVIVNE